MSSLSKTDRTQVWGERQAWVVNKWKLDERMKVQRDIMIPWQRRLDDEEEKQLLAQIEEEQTALTKMSSRVQDTYERMGRTKDSAYVETHEPDAFAVLERVQKHFDRTAASLQ